MTVDGHILAVEDNPVNLKLLVRTLERQGYIVSSAINGQEALDILCRRHPRAFDTVLLDIEMPVMNGYQVLQTIKENPDLRDLPVVMISAVDEIESVVRCIQMGATDYLPKPFNADLLRARVSASLASKRLRDLELEYLEQVHRLTAAAAGLEAGSYELAVLDPVAERPDELGTLARVFQTMAREVRAREERLIAEVRELRIEIDEQRQAKQVAEITESEFYQRLSAEADELRRIVES
jgi:DNA-binding response OmpR family regulator